MGLFRNITHLFSRYRKGEENLRSLFFRGVFWINKFRYDQVRVIDEEWCNLIVLDACRYDLFEEENQLNGRLESRYSLGTHTVDWLKSNFNEKLEDIVYISGNPQVSSYNLKKWTNFKNPFYHLEKVWDYGWDEEQNTVPPEEVVEATRKLKQEYPNKRFIIHFLQPHPPFIGEGTINTTKRQNRILNSLDWKPILNEFSIEEIKESYRKNLQITLKQIRKLKDLEGKTVITADHGEMYGEYGLYSHIPAMYTQHLMKVPWFTWEKQYNSRVKKVV